MEACDNPRLIGNHPNRSLYAMNHLQTPGHEKPRPDDYVYFERSTEGFSTDAVARSTAAKIKLVSFYKMAVDSARERNAR
jgi:protein-serine/threonine kinase